MVRFTQIPVLVCGLLLGGGSACRVQSAPPASRTTAPSDSEIPKDAFGVAVRRGLALLTATRDSLPDHVGNALRCTSCHLDAGRRENGSWVGVYARYPQYRSRRGGVELIEDRINDCFQRSMNGTALAPDGADMRDIVAYFAFLSWNSPVGRPVPNARLQRFAALTPDSAAGHRSFQTTCARCHGDNGQGSLVAAPLWGEKSFNIGAGMARVRTAASFIRDNMPFDKPGSLSDQEAFDVASFVVSQPRPDFAGKENDWPRGDPPPDVAYPTRAATAGRAP
jgi:thiosulfate dehydrogenase